MDKPRSSSSLLTALVLALGVAGCDDERPRDVPPPRSDQPETPPVVSCGAATVSDQGVGVLRIGRPISEIRSFCTVLRDTVVRKSEGQMARVILVPFDTGTIEAEVVDDRIWRVELTSPDVQTNDSLGVGTPLSRILGLRGVRPASGEGGVFVLSEEHCGLSFQLAVSRETAASPPRDLEALRRLPLDTRVARVLVVGCGDR